MKVGPVQVQWLGHASFHLIFNEKHIYIDPYQIGRTRPDADYILITHNHYDHLSVEDIDNVLTEDTVIVMPQSAREKLSNLRVELKTIQRGQTIEFDDFVLEAVPSYNINKKFHPKDSDWVGYILTFGKTRIYHAGDTDVIDEMDGIEVDLALLPVSGTYVMNAKEAASALTKIKAKRAVPMHYGAIVGDDSDAEMFKKLAPKTVKVKILEKS